MRIGWEIVVAGRDFDPGAFFQQSKIQPSHISRREAGDAGQRYYQQVVEFSDWHEETYPLDMVTEVLDYLKNHRAEFERLCRLPGVEERCLNFVEAAEGSFEFSMEDISLLASLGFSVCACVMRHE